LMSARRLLRRIRFFACGVFAICLPRDADRKGARADPHPVGARLYASAP
jgi:hypothetical protein